MRPARRVAPESFTNKCPLCQRLIFTDPPTAIDLLFITSPRKPIRLVTQHPHSVVINITQVVLCTETIKIFSHELHKPMPWERPLVVKERTVDRYYPKQPPKYKLINFENLVGQPLRSKQRK
jgi:hypothetical protein